MPFGGLFLTLKTIQICFKCHLLMHLFQNAHVHFFPLHTRAMLKLQNLGALKEKGKQSAHEL